MTTGTGSSNLEEYVFGSSGAAPAALPNADGTLSFTFLRRGDAEARLRLESATDFAAGWADTAFTVLGRADAGDGMEEITLSVAAPEGNGPPAPRRFFRLRMDAP